MKNTPHLFVIVSSNKNYAVIFRTTGRKLTLLVKWDLTSDLITHGQWIDGRIFNDACDISPNGKYLIYKINKKVTTKDKDFGVVTIISRLPNFTALGMWGNRNQYAGGGFFESDDIVHISSDQEQVFSSKQGRALNTLFDADIAIKEYGSVFNYKRILNQWVYKGVENDCKIMQKTSSEYRIQELLYLNHKNHMDHTPLLHYNIFDNTDRFLFEISDVDWADFDKKGDLLFAKYGCLYRLKKNKIAEYAEKGMSVVKLIEDFTPLTFKSTPPTNKGLRW